MFLKKDFKTAFTVFELAIVTGIIFLLTTIGFESFVNGKKRTDYDIAISQIIGLIKEVRSYSSTNFVKSGSGNSGFYIIPKGGYGIEINNLGYGKVGLRTFYNNNDNLYFDTGDEKIKEWNSDIGIIYFSKMSGSGSVSRGTTGSDVVETGLFSSTIIFHNDGNIYIGSGTGNNLKNLSIEMYMKYGTITNFRQKRIRLDRLEKILRIEEFKKGSSSWEPAY